MLHTTKTHIKLFAGEAPQERAPESAIKEFPESIVSKLETTKDMDKLSHTELEVLNAYYKSLPKVRAVGSTESLVNENRLTSTQRQELKRFLKAYNESLDPSLKIDENKPKADLSILRGMIDRKKPLPQERTRTNSAEIAENTPRLSRALKIGDQGKAVEELQKALKIDVDGKFGSKTEAALKSYQKANNLTEDGIAGTQTLTKLGILAQVVSTTRSPATPEPIRRVESQRRTPRSPTPERGEIPRGRAPMDIRAPRAGVQVPVQRNSQITREGAEVIRDLETVNYFLDAHNRTYGQRGEMISNRNGIVGIVWQLSNPDSRRLARELGMSEDRIKAYGDSLGLDNSKVTDGLIRMALIAVVSGLLSAGTSVALEILGINLTRDYKSGPEMKKILALMGASGDIDAKRTNVLRNPRTTSRDLEGQGEVLRRQNMLPASLRKAVREITSTGFFLTDIFSDLFGGAEKRELEGFIAQFEQSRTLDEAEAILTTIVAILTKKHYEKHGSGAVNSTIADLSKVLQTIRQLKAKNDKVRGKGFDAQRYNRDAASIQAVLDATYGTPNKRINVRGQSYAPALPRNLNPNTLHAVAQMMVDTRVNGDRYSILTNVMRGVQFHYGISFTPDEFISAFTNMRWMGKSERFEFNKRVLSNTGRQRNENFNGLSSTAGVAVMELNGRKIYFKDACTNVLTYVNEIPTVIESASSVPVAIPVGTVGIFSPKPKTGGGFGSTPGERVTGNVNTGGVTNTPAQTGTQTVTGGFRPPVR